MSETGYYATHDYESFKEGLVGAILFARTPRSRRDQFPLVRAMIRTTEEELADLESPGVTVAQRWERSVQS